MFNLFKPKKNNEKLVLDANTDWEMLSKLIQQCNNNPDLRIDISLPDTTIIHLKTYKNSGLRDIYV